MVQIRNLADGNKRYLTLDDAKVKGAFPSPSAGEYQWQDVFLRLLATNGNITHAAKGAGITRQAAYWARNADDAFKAAWDDAREQAIDTLELEAHRRAMKSSDLLIIFLLKALRPEKYREHQQLELTGKSGAPVAFTIGIDRPTPQLAEQARTALAAPDPERMDTLDVTMDSGTMDSNGRAAMDTAAVDTAGPDVR
jgi:hypothetical protein